MVEYGDNGLDEIWLEYIGAEQASPITNIGKPEGKEEPRINACNNKEQGEWQVNSDKVASLKMSLKHPMIVTIIQVLVVTK